MDGNEEIISLKRIFGNGLLWSVKRRVQNPDVNGYVGGRVRLFLLVMVSVLEFGARKMFHELLV
jgi:hypothetical protein